MRHRWQYRDGETCCARPGCGVKKYPNGRAFKWTPVQSCRPKAMLAEREKRA